MSLPTGSSSFLAGLSADERERLLEGARERPFTRGQVLLRQGALGDGVLLITKGTAKVVATRADRPTVVALRGPGDLIGELATLDGTQRASDVVALEDGLALALDGERFRLIFGEVATARRQVVNMLAQRVREGTSSWTESSTLDVTGRMAARVLELADRYGQVHADGSIAIDPPLSRGELASWAGGSREAGARAMRALRETGWISEEGRRIVVHDRSSLERMAAG